MAFHRKNSIHGSPRTKGKGENKKRRGILKKDRRGRKNKNRVAFAECPTVSSVRGSQRKKTNTSNNLQVSSMKKGG